MNRMGIEAIYLKPNTSKKRPKHPVYPYLYAYDSVSAAKQGLEHYLTKHNQQRPHSSLDRMTPDEFYFDNRSLLCIGEKRT